MVSERAGLFWVCTSGDQQTGEVSSSLVGAVSQPPVASSAVPTKREKEMNGDKEKEKVTPPVVIVGMQENHQSQPGSGPGSGCWNQLRWLVLGSDGLSWQEWPDTGQLSPPLKKQKLQPPEQDNARIHQSVHKVD
jgi:hypothetical protein